MIIMLDNDHTMHLFQVFKVTAEEENVSLRDIKHCILCSDQVSFAVTCQNST